MRIVLRTVVLLFSLLFAAFVGVSTFVIGNQVKAPPLATAVAWPIATLAPANDAYNGYSARLSRNPAARVTTAERKNALTTYLSEPLSVPGLALLETSRLVANPATNFAYLRTVSELSRRTTYVNRRLAETYGRQGDTVHMFRWLSRTAKTNRDFERAYVASLAASLSLRGAVEGITPLVGEDPPWREEFWRLAVRNTPALDRAAAIRKNLIRAPWRQTRIDQDEQWLLAALAAAGRFDTALDLASALASANHIRSFAPQGQLVRNDRFRAQSRLEPFDWRLSRSSDIVSAIYPKEPGLSVGAITGSSGTAAQQLIQLTPGAYSLAWSISAFEKWGAHQVAVRLRCAETGVAAAPIDPVFLDDKAGNVRVTVPAGDCGWYWLSLDIAVPDDGSGMDIVVNRLSLAAAASGSEAPAATVPTAAKPAIVAP
jgi:hypothetical protein